MKAKVFSILAILMMAVTTAYADEVPLHTFPGGYDNGWEYKFNLTEDLLGKIEKLEVLMDIESFSENGWGQVKYAKGEDGNYAGFDAIGIKKYAAGEGTVDGANNAIVQLVGKGRLLAYTITYSDNTTQTAGVWDIPEVTPPVAKSDLVYSGSEQELVSAAVITSGSGTIEYSLDESTWNTDIPTGTAVGDYTVYYRVKYGESKYYEPTYNGITVTVSNFSWDAATNTGTLTMPASDVVLEIEYKADLTLSVSIEGWTYGATASAPTVSGNESGGAVTYEYKVKGAADDTYTADVPTAAGDYTVRATVAETDDYADAVATADFTIQKAAAAISYETASVSKTFGDADFTNDLTNAGDGIVSYASDNEGVATVDSKTGLVTITGAPGRATITATVTDGTNYAYATKTATFTVGVETAAITVSAQGFTGTYDGESHSISVTVTEPEGTTVKYGTTAGQYTLDAAPTYTAAGEYTVYYQVTKPNYTTVENSAVVSIAKAAAAISYAETAVTKAQDDKAFTNELTVTGDGTVSYASDNVNVATVDPATGLVTITGTGTGTIKATVADGTNYTYATKTAQYTLTVTAATGIKAIDNGQPATDSAEDYYDLSGRHVSKPTKGVFIQNGRKVVIK